MMPAAQRRAAGPSADAAADQGHTMRWRGRATGLAIGLCCLAGCDLPASAPDSAENVADVSSPLGGDESATPLPAGRFSARVTNASSSSAHVSFDFTLAGVVVHRTNLFGVKPGESLPVAGPEMASQLVVSGERGDAKRLTTREYVFGIDVTEGGEVIYVITDPQPDTPVDEEPQAPIPDDNSNPVDEPDADTNGVSDTDSNGLTDLDTNGLDDVATNGAEDADDDPDRPWPPPVVAPDCDGNGIIDSTDIATGQAEDCNSNSVPDLCELTAGTSTDCDTNGVLDECDIATGRADDCNVNGEIDACEIRDGLIADCNSNDVPDDCDPDCDGDGLPDDCAIAAGLASDANTNGMPDTCECPAINEIGEAQITQLLECVAGPAASYPADAVICRCFDFDSDGDVDLRDFAYFQCVYKP